MEDLITLAQAQLIGIYVTPDSWLAAELGVALQGAGFDVDLTPDYSLDTGERVFLLHFRPAVLSLN